MSDGLGGVKGGVWLVACLIVSTGCRSHRRRGWALVRCRREATGAERGHARSTKWGTPPRVRGATRGAILSRCGAREQSAATTGAGHLSVTFAWASPIAGWRATSRERACRCPLCPSGAHGAAAYAAHRPQTPQPRLAAAAILSLHARLPKLHRVTHACRGYTIFN